MRLATKSIVMHESAQSRVELDWVTIMSYAEDMRAGDEFPPVVVFHDGKTYWLADGFHRVRAALETEAETIAADVRQGTLIDAQWFSCGANQKQGLRRTNADKRESTIRAIKLWPQLYSNRMINYSEIARQVGVTKELVSKLGSELLQNNCQNLTIAPTVTNTEPVPEQTLVQTQLVIMDEKEEGEEVLPVPPVVVEQEPVPSLVQEEDAVLAEDRAEVAEQELWEEDQVLMQSAERVIVSTVDGGEINIYQAVTLVATISGLAIPAWTKVYWTVKRATSEADTDAILQLVETNPSAGTDGLLRVNGAAGTAGNGSLTVDQAAGTVVIDLVMTVCDDLALATGLVWSLKALHPTSAATLLATGTVNVLGQATMAVA